MQNNNEIFAGLIWCFNQIGKLSRPGEPVTGGPITTQSPHSICAKWMVERNCTSLKLACRLTDSTAIPVDGSKPIGNQCRKSSTRVLLATKREQQVRLPDNELTKENSEQAPSLSVACLATSNVRCLHTRPANDADRMTAPHPTSPFPDSAGKVSLAATPGIVARVAAAPLSARAAKILQSSTCSEMLRASSTSIPRYRTVLSSFVCPSRS